jgi:BirA family biotin operon repressor/biotin-[acetyl-CoA-carboxylase] ligase
MIIGSDIRFLKDLGSTNTYLTELLRREKPPEGSIVRTNYQSAGKGQQGNSWESEDGKNLLFSIVLYPDMILPAGQFLISMVISLGIQDFLKKIISGCKIKWPNDIYAGDQKIAGILIENSVRDDIIENSVAGIGLNINQTDFPPFIPNAVSIKSLTGKDQDIDHILSNLVMTLDHRYKNLISGEFDQIRSDYISALYGINEFHSFKTVHGDLTGRIISVSDSGLLQVEDQFGKIHQFSFKEIEFTHLYFSSF